MIEIAKAGRWLGCVILIGLCLIVIWSPHSIEQILQRFEDESERVGNWGPLLFGLLYVAAVLALLPGSAFTLMAGALFGLVGGTIVASVASTTGAALAFLLGRFVARPRIEAWLARYPSFDALDKAISESGWKVVALLRLSPAVPFNLQNYLYGLTGIRFWPYLLTSWLAMLPATFLYVYLGNLGRAGLEAAGGEGKRARSPSEWAMLIVGFLATVVLTVYLSRQARRALRQIPPFQREP